MTEYYYDIYFDPADLEVDRHGDLKNWDALQIVQFTYDDDTDEATSCRRVSITGDVIEDPWKDLQYKEDLVHVGFGDDASIIKSCNRFVRWLSDNTAWVESSPETRWQPAEYICIGIIGYTD